MTSSKPRRLLAVIFTDVVGYTALMQRDDEAARIVRRRHREVLEAAVSAHGGELFQYLGDGSVTMFPSVADAVRAAIEVQRGLRQEPVVPLRIGIHQGDISYDTQGAYGDAMNVAARIQSLGTTGSILISGKAHDEIKNQPDITTTPLGEFELKNVEESLEVYGIVADVITVPTRDHVLTKIRSAAATESNATIRLNTALEGRYYVEGELGEGGMATVYLADDLKHERKVALKEQGTIHAPIREEPMRLILSSRMGLAHLLLLFLVFAAGAQAQVSEMIGRVTDIDGDPIPGATVSLEQDGFVTTTDGQGEFRLPDLPPGLHEILVTAIGYRRRVVQHQMREGVSDNLLVQLQSDAIVLDGVLVSTSRLPGAAHPAPDVLGTLILAGAKSTIIELADLPANLAEKTGRQVFSKVPGAFVYDMDGSGNQINISTRGLDPHRSWELNVRQDGVLINSDMYGYPASHYSPPMEAIESIEMVRGTAALQYGSQFGGLVNYVTKSPEPGEVLEFESASTVGSFGLLSTYNAAGGRAGPVTFYAYMNERVSDGYRDAARSEYSAQYFAGTVDLSPTLRLRGQVDYGGPRVRENAT